MSDYLTQMLEADSKGVEPTSIWEVSFETDISPEGDMIDDCLDVEAGSDGQAAIEKTRKYVLSEKYLSDEAHHFPTKFVLKGLRLLATGYIR